MNKLEFVDFLEHPEKLKKQDLASMDELLNQFAYCQTLQLLKAKALHNSSSVLFDIQLRIAAAYASNRKVLYYLIHSDQYKPTSVSVSSTKDTIEEIPTQNFLSNTEVQEDLAITDPSEVTTEKDEILFENTDIKEETIREVEESEPSISTTEDLLESEATTAQTEEPLLDSKNDTNLSEKNDELLIEILSEEITSTNVEEEVTQEYHGSFTFSQWLNKTSIQNKSFKKSELLIKLDPTEEIQPLIEDEINELIITNVFNEGYLITEEKYSHDKSKEIDESPQEKIIDTFINTDTPKIFKNKKEENPNSLENKARKSSEESGIPVTETLAKIYLNQKLYLKAIQAYEKLSLKYPEKKAYFANLITEIKTENKIN